MATGGKRKNTTDVIEGAEIPIALSQTTTDMEVDATGNSPLLPVLIFSLETSLQKQHPIKLYKELREKFGNIPKTRRGECGGYVLYPVDAQQREALMQVTSLMELQVKATTPSRYTEIKGILKGVHPEILEQELFEVISSQYPHLKSVKFLRSPQTEASETWPRRSLTAMVVFEGTVLPSEGIVIGYGEPHKFHRYINKPLQCRKCAQFGHTRGRCANSPRCLHCDLPHERKSCPTPWGPPRCANCNGAHEATSPGCPVWHRRQLITTVMYEEDVSFREAARKVDSAEDDDEENRRSSCENWDLRQQIVQLRADTAAAVKDLKEQYELQISSLHAKLDTLVALVSTLVQNMNNGQRGGNTDKDGFTSGG